MESEKNVERNRESEKRRGEGKRERKKVRLALGPYGE